MANPNRTDSSNHDKKAHASQNDAKAPIEKELKGAHDSLMGKPLEKHIRELNALFSRNRMPNK